jgi:hypothetical protein
VFRFMTAMVMVVLITISLNCAKEAERGADRASSSAADFAADGVILLTQAQFVTTPEGNPVPGPARMERIHVVDGTWEREVFQDSLSNVFHKALVISKGGQTGVLTIGANGAALSFWDLTNDGQPPERLWTPVFGGKHNRLRDVEIGDVDGDGQREFVIATHDQGVVAVCDEELSGLAVTMVDSQPRTFVHEIEIGDLDGDGAKEFYATPSQPNRARGGSQPGKVVQYRWDGKAYQHRVVASYDDTHAKEITVCDMDKDGKDELYVVKEAVVTSRGDAEEVDEPVAVLRYTWNGSEWKTDRVFTLPDRQCRFLVPTDLDGDSRFEFVAAGFKSGLWWVKPRQGNEWNRQLIDADSSGFEHACAAADMNGDGTDELYVASDDQKELRRYELRAGSFHKQVLLPLVGDVITWGLTVDHL